MCITLPVSAIVATCNRNTAFGKLLESLASQSVQPVEMVVVDGSTDEETREICLSFIPQLSTKLIYCKAQQIGAAAQRNQAINYASQEYLLFLDDDIIFEPECIARLWKALEPKPELGGVNAMIMNQQYTAPGRISRLLFRTLHGKQEASYAGKCIGPALNLLPEDRPDLPEVVPVEWLNTTCTLYRREALPVPTFSSHFTGYSLLEDLALSVTVGKKWRLANARTALIYHNSQPGTHKANVAALAKMELINRHYVMTHILNRRKMVDYLKLGVLELFGIVASLSSRKNWSKLPAILRGKFAATALLLSSAVAQTRSAENIS